MVTGSASPAGGGVNKDPAPFSYSEQFYEQLPYYLSIGMTWDEYWNDDCMKAKYYRQAFELSKKRDNQKLWMLGAYFYEALCDVTPVLHAFAKKGSKPLPYPSEPFPLTKKEAEDIKKAKELAKTATMKARMASWAAQDNAMQAKLSKEVKQDGWNDG